MATVSAPAPVPAPAAGPAAKPNFVERNHFWLRRLHSLTGVAPIGGFILFHFYENGSIFYGAKAYDEVSSQARGVRYLEVIEIAFILLPLLYHALYGLFIAAYSRNNTMRYNYSRRR